MKTGFARQGFGIICQHTGVIDQFVRDEFSLNEAFLGKHFKELLDSGSWAKSQAFFDEVRQSGIAADWELDVTVRGTPRTMHFVGGAVGPAYFICGVFPKNAMPLYLRELIETDIPDNPHIRDTVQRIIEIGSPQISEADAFECLTSLNNELLNVQRDLQKTNIQLKRINDEKNRALGVVAHDLRNPIAVLSMYATYLLQSLEGKVTHEELECVRTIKRTASSMNKLVNDVLDVAAIESGQLVLDVQEIDVAWLLKDIVGHLNPLAREQDVQLELSSQVDACPIPADAGKLEQVFNNVIDNAIKFSPAGGVVEVLVSSTETRAEITISDSGPGISQDALDKLFQPFSPGRAKSPRGNSGTGLGLSIARRIVEGHGGTIEAASTSKPGTIFRISLPRLS